MLGADLLAMDAQRLNSTGAGTDKIPHSFVAFIRNPDRCELAGPQ